MNYNHSDKQLYTCPMHPKIVKNSPGKCPGCGMDLITKKTDPHAGHDMQKMSHADHEAAMTNPAIAKQMEKDIVAGPQCVAHTLVQYRRAWIPFGDYLIKTYHRRGRR